MSGALDPRERAAWRNLLGSYRTIEERLTAYLAPHKLTMGEFGIMIALAEAEPSGGVKMGDLADKALMSASHLSHRIRRLEKKGLAERAADPQDRRCTLARLTGVGQDRFRELVGGYSEIIRENLLERLSGDERQQLAALLYRVNPRVLDSVG